MLESLKQLDTELLLFFNGLNNSVLDFIFFWISDKWIWIPFYAFLAWIIYRNHKPQFLYVLVFIAIAITLSDQLASAVIKEHVMRLRPCHEPAIASRVHLVNNYCGGQFGFVSSHASNVFALAAFLSGLLGRHFGRLKKILWIWASVVSFSRIYLGAHYPGDVICGAILGISVGVFTYYLYGRIIETISKRKIKN